MEGLRGYGKMGLFSKGAPRPESRHGGDGRVRFVLWALGKWEDAIDCGKGLLALWKIPGIQISAGKKGSEALKENDLEMVDRLRDTTSHLEPIRLQQNGTGDQAPERFRDSWLWFRRTDKAGLDRVWVHRNGGGHRDYRRTDIRVDRIQSQATRSALPPGDVCLQCWPSLSLPLSDVLFEKVQGRD